jgi:hypothetical protein
MVVVQRFSPYLRFKANWLNPVIQPTLDNMERCMDCNSLLTKEETVCIECGTKVGGDEAGVKTYGATLVSLLFYASVAALVTSPFLEKGPSFMFCLFITCALLFIMRTAKDSAEKLRKH